MPAFREEAHPRDESGKFIETGGEKLKTWGKVGARTLKGYATPSPNVGYDDPGRAAIGDPGAVERRREDLSDLRETQSTIRRLKKEKRGWEENLRSAMRAGTRGSDEDITRIQGKIKGLTDRIANQEHLERQKQIGRARLSREMRSKTPPPHGGTDPSYARPSMGRSKIDIFHRMGGDEKQISEFQNSQEMSTAFSNIAEQNKLKGEISGLREKISGLHRERAHVDNLIRDFYKDDSNFSKPGESVGMNERGAKLFEELKARKTKTMQDFQIVNDQFNARRGELESAQKANEGLFSGILGPLHASATNSWIGNVWSGTAGEMQQVANKRMGIKWRSGSGYEKQSWKEQAGIPDKVLLPEGRAENKRRMDEMADYMKKQYNLNQASLRRAGFKPGDKITLYRGMDIPDKAMAERERLKTETAKRSLGKRATQLEIAQAASKVQPSMHISQRPLTSWTDKPEIASEFPGEMILKAEVPIERIYSNYRLFKNTYDENEHVVLGATDIPVKIVPKVYKSRDEKVVSEKEGLPDE